jgi:hypothetical protein
MTYDIAIRGTWSLDELSVLEAAFADATAMFGTPQQLRALIDDARRVNDISAEQLVILRIGAGRASFRHGGDVFQILLGDSVFGPQNFAEVPLCSRPTAVGAHDVRISAKLSILHELMHVAIAGQPDILAIFEQTRLWGTPQFAVETGPQDGRSSFALANLTLSTGPEEDLVIAMALYAHAYASGAKSSYRFYLQTMYGFHMIFIWSAWELTGEVPQSDVEDYEIVPPLPVCHSATC